MKFGENLKQERKKMQLTQEEVAKELNVSRQTISSWENERSYPDISSLVTLSDFYHISLDVLLREDDCMIQHYDEQNEVVNKGKKVAVISYWVNVVLVVLMVATRITHWKFLLSIGDMASLIMNLNVVVFLVFRYLMKANQLPKHFILKGLGIFLLFLILIASIAVASASKLKISANTLGYNCGLEFGMMTQALSVILILFYPRKAKEKEQQTTMD